MERDLENEERTRQNGILVNGRVDVKGVQRELKDGGERTVELEVV